MKNIILTHKQAEKIGDKLYEKYGKPLEKDHWGEFIVISQKGQTLLGEDMNVVAFKALKLFGPGGFLFKVGEKVVGRMR